MIVPPGVKHHYEATERVIETIGDKVRDVLLAYCTQRMYPFIGRPKSLASVAEKIETGRYKAWSDLDDLYGCTVIIPSLTLLKEMLGYISTQFDVLEVRSRASSFMAPDVFRFDSLRVYARLRPPDKSLSSEPIFQSQFEIQVRTAYEHAWIVATHPLIYKADSVSWKRFRLAAQMKAMVEQLDSLNVSFADVAAKIPSSRWPEVVLQANVIEQFKVAVEKGDIIRDAVPSSWRRFSDNFIALVKATHEPRKVAREGARALKLVIDEISANYSGGKSLMSVSLLQLSLGILCEKRFFKDPPTDYSALVTPELEAFFPAASALTNRFTF